jgi:hypothetical protein
MLGAGDKSASSVAPVSVAKKTYQAYVNKDRAAIESLVAEDFRFTSPLDNCINRETYFARCWARHARLAIWRRTPSA